MAAYGLYIPPCGLHVAACGLHIAPYGLHVAPYGLHVAPCGHPVATCVPLRIHFRIGNNCGIASLCVDRLLSLKDTQSIPGATPENSHNTKEVK